jgi:hypothetical protein
MSLPSAGTIARLPTASAWSRLYVAPKGSGYCISSLLSPDDESSSLVPDSNKDTCSTTSQGMPNRGSDSF